MEGKQNNDNEGFGWEHKRKAYACANERGRKKNQTEMKKKNDS